MARHGTRFGSWAAMILMCMIFCQACGADKDDLIIDNWQVLYSQNPDLSAVSHETGWEPTAIPSWFTPPYMKKNGYRNMWLRGRVTVGGDPSRYSGLSMGFVMHANRVYVNSRFIGEDRYGGTTPLVYPRSYVLPPGCLKAGVNDVYVMIGIYGNQSGTVSDLPRIHGPDSFTKRKVLDRIMYQYIPGGVCIALFMQFLFAIVLYCVDRRESSALIGAAFFLLCAIDLLTGFSPWNPFSPDLNVVIQNTILIIIFLIDILLIQSIYHVYLWELNIVLLVYALTAIVLSFLVIDSTSHFYFSAPFLIITFLLLNPLFYYTLFRVNRIKPDRANMVSLVVMSITLNATVALFVIQFVSGINLLLYLIALLPLTIILFNKGIVIFVVNHRIMNETAASELMRSMPLTPSASEQRSEKIVNHITAFLAGNYSKYISIEAIASAFYMQLGELNRLFKKQCGKTVQEYINDLRIAESVRKLKKTDASIPEIAFSVGFRSMWMFKRAFINSTGKQPVQFRSNDTQF